MKNQLVTSILIFVVVFCGFTAFPSSRAQAQASNQLPTVVMAIVDIQKIMRVSAASQSIRIQIDTIRTGFQAKLDAKEERLRGEDEELKRQRAILAPDAFEERRKAFEDEVMGVQREIQAQNAIIEKAIEKATRQIRDSVLPILEQIMQERGATVFMDSSQVLFAAETLEVTATALERLNKLLPSVVVEISEPE